MISRGNYSYTVAALLGVSVAVVAFVSTRAALGDVSPGEVTERGREIYGRCLACHAIEYDRVGPRHCGLFGRPAGSVPGFEYSEAMRRSGIVWNRESLDAFLRAPTRFVPQTTMTYAGVPDAQERAQLIAWLAEATAIERCVPQSQ